MSDPVANYALAVETSLPARMLHTSGIVPVENNGGVPASLADQARTIWSTIGAILSEAHMDVSDIVSAVTYVVVGEDLTVVMAARNDFFGTHRAASTLITVPALARPEWKVEIAIVAAV